MFLKIAFGHRRVRYQWDVFGMVSSAAPTVLAILSINWTGRESFLSGGLGRSEGTGGLLSGGLCRAMRWDEKVYCLDV